MRNAIREIVKDKGDVVAHAKQHYEKNSEDFSEKFREQNRSHNENMSIIRDQYNKLSQIHQRKQAALKEKLEKDALRESQIREKRKLDLEGFQSDLQNLRKRMQFYQNYIGKLKKLVDTDQAVYNTALGQLERINEEGNEEE